MKIYYRLKHVHPVALKVSRTCQSLEMSTAVPDRCWQQPLNKWESLPEAGVVANVLIHALTGV